MYDALKYFDPHCLRIPGQGTDISQASETLHARVLLITKAFSWVQGFLLLLKA